MNNQAAKTVSDALLGLDFMNVEIEINNIQIAMAGIGIVTIIQAQKSHS